MASETLKSCPFCGGEAETVGDDCMEWIAECIECCASSMAFATEAEAIAAWNARATGGTLTAEQVREAIACNSWQETSMLFEFNDSSWQAIADELNAELGSWTCKLLVDGDLLHCSNCGGAAEKQSWTYWHYCPNCGARVVE